MKIREVITNVDDLKPNAYSEEDKKRWLKEIETKIYKEIVMTHEDACEMTDFTNENSNLIAQTPYDTLYITYVCAKIDFYNNETARYNNQMMMFNQEYFEFGNWYNRNHMPITRS